MIILDLNTNDAEALLEHCKTFRATSGDAREDRRLEHALDELADAIVAHLHEQPAE